MMTPQNTTIDPEEIERFSRIASEWWNLNGKFKPLHRINPLRIEYILEQVSGDGCQVTDKEKTTSSDTRHPSPVTPLKGLRLLDIGCGGGLICEPMARLGAHVTGIDASEKNIKVASLHAQQNGLGIDYRCTSAEALVTGDGYRVTDKEKTTSSDTRHPSPAPPSYDIILALEIIEHVADIPAFVTACCNLLKPGGLMIWSTINRTPKSYALAILGAEYVLRWVPIGTHTWKKFVKPSELHTQLRHNGLTVTDMIGMTMNPLNFKWQLTKNDLSVNYLLTARKM